MLVAIPTDDEVTIAAHTGRCKGFVIYEIVDGKSSRTDYRVNGFTHHAQQHEHGESHECSHGHHTHEAHSHTGLIDAIEDCDTILAVGMGQGLINDMHSHGKQVLFSNERTISQALALLESGKFISNPKGSACHH